MLLNKCVNSPSTFPLLTFEFEKNAPFYRRFTSLVQYNRVCLEIFFSGSVFIFSLLCPWQSCWFLRPTRGLIKIAANQKSISFAGLIGMSCNKPPWQLVVRGLTHAQCLGRRQEGSNENYYWCNIYRQCYVLAIVLELVLPMVIMLPNCALATNSNTVLVLPIVLVVVLPIVLLWNQLC